VLEIRDVGGQDNNVLGGLEHLTVLERRMIGRPSREPDGELSAAVVDELGIERGVVVAAVGTT
jgi:hypothetical protein